MSRTRTAFAIRIDVAADTTETDANIGLNAGYIQLITGRADLDGSDSIVPLTYEDGSAVSGTYYEGFISKDSPSNATNSIDITEGGNYGSLSSFSFSIRNNGALYSAIKSAGINLLGKTIVYYGLIGTILYPQFTGTISAEPLPGKTFKISAIYNTKNKHSLLPPNQATATEYTNIDSDNTGKTIPIILGDVPYTEAVVVDSVYQPEYVVSGNATGDQETYDKKMTYITDYYTNYEWVNIGGGETSRTTLYKLEIFTGLLTVTEGQWATGDYYFRVYMDKEGNTDDSELVLITGNTASDVSNRRVIITLNQPPAGLDLSNSIGTALSVEFGDEAGDETVYFPLNEKQLDIGTVLVQVVKLPPRFVLSNGEISNIETDDNGTPKAWIYDEDAAEYEPVNGLAVSSDNTTSNDVNHPYVSTKGGVSTSDGEVEIYDFFKPTSAIRLYTTILNSSDKQASSPDFLGYPSVLDDDGSIDYSWAQNDSSGAKTSNVIAFKISLPDDVDYTQYDSVHIGVNCSLTNASFSGYNDFTTRILGVFPSAPGKIGPYDSLSQWSHNGSSFILDNMLDDTVDFSEEAFGPTSMAHNCVPASFYEDLNPSKWPEQSYFNYWPAEVSETGGLIRDIKAATTLNGFGDMVKYSSVDKRSVMVLIYSNWSTQFKDIVIFGIKKQNVFKDLRFRVSGETVDGNETNSVYRTFQHILETYDGIDSSNIDYGNLETYRESWHVGRTITEQKNSYDYLQSLCKQSFTSLSIKRNGDIRLNAFLDDTTTPLPFDKTNILRGSFGAGAETQLAKCYNEFVLNFTKNVDAGNYDSQLFVKNITKDEFPESDGDWGEYVGGINSYHDAKTTWEICKAAYDKTGAIQLAPDSLSNLDWYIDKALFDSNEAGQTTNSAWKLLNLLVGWTTLKKKIVSYSVPFNAESATIEVMDVATVTDTILTNGELRTGYIIKTELDSVNCVKKLQVMLIPTDIAFPDDNNIVETGTQENTYTESGTETDQIIETGSN